MMGRSFLGWLPVIARALRRADEPFKPAPAGPRLSSGYSLLRGLADAADE